MMWDEFDSCFFFEDKEAIHTFIEKYSLFDVALSTKQKILELFPECRLYADIKMSDFNGNECLLITINLSVELHQIELKDLGTRFSQLHSLHNPEKRLLVSLSTTMFPTPVELIRKRLSGN